MSSRTRAVLIDRGAQTSTPLLAALERAGLEVHLHYGAGEAIADFPRTAPDVIVIFDEPGTRFAREAVSAVRLDDLGRLTPVLLVAAKGHPLAGRGAALYDAGFTALIEAPCSDDDFVHAVTGLAAGGLTPPHRVVAGDELDALDQEFAAALDELDHEPAQDLEVTPPPVREPLSAPSPPAPVPPPRPLVPGEPGFAGGHYPTAGELGFHERGPEGVVPREAVLRMDAGFRVARADPNAQLRMVVTLGMGALLAAAGVGFFVWLLVYTRFNGYEDAIPTVPRIEEDNSSNQRSQRDRDDRDRGNRPEGGQAAEGAEGDASAGSDSIGEIPPELLELLSTARAASAGTSGQASDGTGGGRESGASQGGDGGADDAPPDDAGDQGGQGP